MHNLRIFTFSVLLLSTFCIILAKPVLKHRRQVVQPTWLTNGVSPINLFADSRVRVNAQNLKEAAAIRAGIQKAVNDGTFAVQMRNPSANNGSGVQVDEEQAVVAETTEAMDPDTSPPTPDHIPLWDYRFPTTMQTEMNGNFMRDMQQAWFDFIGFTRQMFGWQN